MTDSGSAPQVEAKTTQRWFTAAEEIYWSEDKRQSSVSWCNIVAIAEIIGRHAAAGVTPTPATETLPIGEDFKGYSVHSDESGWLMPLNSFMADWIRRYPMAAAPGSTSVPEAREGWVKFAPYTAESGGSTSVAGRGTDDCGSGEQYIDEQSQLERSQPAKRREK